MDPTIEQAFSLAGRVAVVTGAASGIGAQVATTFARAGASVVLADVDHAGLELTVRSIAEVGGRSFVRPTDVSDRAAVEALADDAIGEFGRVDVWANVAAIIRYFSILDAPETLARAIVDVNLFGVYWGVAAAGRVMRPAGVGSIINVGSGGGEVGAPMVSAYGMAKAGVLQLTRTAAAEFGTFGVRVNAVSPGWIDTPMVAVHYTDADGTVDQDRRQAIRAQRAGLSPLNITGEPLDIALCMLYLASDASRFVTGQTLRPNGGFHMA